MEKCSRCQINEAEIKCNKCKKKYCKICDYYLHIIMKNDIHNKGKKDKINSINIKQTEQSINIKSTNNIINKNTNKELNNISEINKDNKKKDNEIDKDNINYNKACEDKDFNDKLKAKRHKTLHI